VSHRENRNAPRLRAVVAIATVVVAMAPLQLAFAGATYAGTAPKLTTDLADYSPEMTVQVSGTGLAAGTALALPVLRPDGSIVKGDGSFTPGWDTVTTDAQGNLAYSYQLDGVEGLYVVRAYPAPWSGDWTQTPLASVMFTDATVNMDQCRNGPFSAPVQCTGSAWANGDSQATQAHWREGDSLPYRIRFSTTVGSHTLTISWDTTKGGKHAIDYLTTYNRTETTANACSGVSGCGSPAPFAIPTDTNVTGRGVPQAAGNFTCFNCTITAASSYSLSGTYASDSTTQITLTFTAATTTPVLAWGGHIASQFDWGSGNAASSINGSPYHTAIVNFDGHPGSQDRALAAGAVLPVPSSIATQVSVSTINPGDPVTDDATVTGGTVIPTGSVTFFACGPSATAPDCTTGGTQVGSPITLSGGQATSGSFTPGTASAAAGTYCFRAEYTPDAAAPYSPNKETNTTTECFTQLPASIGITKVADARDVNPTDPIGFTITVTSPSAGTAYDVQMTDPLPTNATGLSWSIDGGTGAALCQISGTTLTCNYATMASGASYTVHVGSPTGRQTTCDPLLVNTATVTTSNAGTASATATTRVRCARIGVTLTPDATPVTHGNQIGFTAVVTDAAKGSLYGVVLTDALPANAGLSWSVDDANSDTGCSISAGVLTCSWGTLAYQHTRQVHIVSPSTKAKTVSDKATVTSTNAWKSPLSATSSIVIV
jgi:uncharacterized repeat protein (TIGR01451 family)